MHTEANSNISVLLPVMEHFYTLQGEGGHQGRAAYFIRLGGCDVGCVWCDVKESWPTEGHPRMAIEQLADLVVSAHAPIAVITGGEPLMHDLDLLTSRLRSLGIRTHLETSGSHRLTGEWDWICLSPKKFKAPLDEILPKADELKVVVFHKSDLEWAEQFASKVSPACRLFLQPEWDRAATVSPWIIEYIKSHPKWQLSLQVHKYLQIP